MIPCIKGGMGFAKNCLPLSIPLIQTMYRETAGPPLIGVLKGTAQLQMFTGLLLALGIAF